MGRKNLLDSLIHPPAEAPAPPAAAPAAEPAPRYARGAIGAVGRSIADLKARALIEIDPFLIDAGGMQDRLEADNAEDAALAHSLREYGQQVPVLVRPHPTAEGRYQIVYGRRRVLALRDLGLPVRALVRDMDDRELVLAQGQENTARRDLSFIEKANFARQMTQAGYDRKVICDALSIDKTVISRMLSVMDQVPLELVEAIGAAPGVGRDRWLSLAQQVAASGEDIETLRGILTLNAAADSSDARFAALAAYLAGSGRRRRAARSVAETRPLNGADGVELGVARRTGQITTLQIKSLKSGDFAGWLVDNIAEIHRRWRDGE